MSGKPLIESEWTTKQESTRSNRDTIPSVSLGHFKQKKSLEEALLGGNVSASTNEMSQMAGNSVSAGIAAALQMSAVTGTAVVSSQSIGSSSTTTTPTSPILTNSTENISPNKKDKPKKTMSTILPWTKGITNQVQCFFPVICILLFHVFHVYAKKYHLSLSLIEVRRFSLNPIRPRPKI